MLVLSRREAEKVLFPNLGITIEITRVQGSTVRLGIDAPKEIRVIRGELEHRPELGYAKQKQTGPKPSPTPDLQKCLDAANLAIHLAQNQLRQNLTEHAETALDQALQCLDDLELAIAESQFKSKQTVAVRESSSSYNSKTTVSGPGENSNQIAAILSNDQHLRKLICEQLDGLGFETIEFDEPRELLNYLQYSDQPSVVVAGDPTPNALDDQEADLAAPNNLKIKAPSRIESQADSQLQIAGVAGLRRHNRTFLIGQDKPSDPIRFTAWFADDKLATEFELNNDFISV